MAAPAAPEPARGRGRGRHRAVRPAQHPLRPRRHEHAGVVRPQRGAVRLRVHRRARHPLRPRPVRASDRALAAHRRGQARDGLVLLRERPPRGGGGRPVGRRDRRSGPPPRPRQPAGGARQVRGSRARRLGTPRPRDRPDHALHRAGPLPKASRGDRGHAPGCPQHRAGDARDVGGAAARNHREPALVAPARRQHRPRGRVARDPAAVERAADQSVVRGVLPPGDRGRRPGQLRHRPGRPLRLRSRRLPRLGHTGPQADPATAVAARARLRSWPTTARSSSPA